MGLLLPLLLLLDSDVVFAEAVVLVTAERVLTHIKTKMG